MYQAFLTPTSAQMYTALRKKLPLEDKLLLDSVLTLTLHEAVARSVPKAKRAEYLSLLRADDSRLVSWLRDTSVSASVVIEEFLLRSLLSLTVQ